ncbi:uncharacterized protein LOC100375637 [Saccoglossus kowalevskii]
MAAVIAHAGNLSKLSKFLEINNMTIIDMIFQHRTLPSRVMSMPKGQRRRRQRRCKDDATLRLSSSSQSSVEITATATSSHGGPTIIATATAPVNTRSERESAAFAMAAILAKELKPEHKLPSKDIAVRPREEFLNLLATVGANGQVFTPRQLLSYLIKYISSRYLYDELDPRRVYCSDDPLGKVFGVKEFTIKDVRNLLFANVTVASENLAEQHDASFQHHKRESLFKQRHYSQPLPGGSDGASTSASSPKSATTTSNSIPDTFPLSMPVSFAPSSVSNVTSTVGKQTTEFTALPGFDLLSERPNEDREPHSSTESSITTHKDTDTHNIQGYETATVADTSDDLWFLEEDARFSVEYEVESNESEGYGFGATSTESESIDSSADVFYEFELCDDSESCFADDDSSDSDSDFTDKDKWMCTKCDVANSPLVRYCVKCCSLREGWLPDLVHKSQLKLARGPRQLKRSISEPVGVVASLTSSLRDVAVTGTDATDIGFPVASGAEREVTKSGEDLLDSSPKRDDDPYEIQNQNAVRDREIRLAEDDAGAWPAFHVPPRRRRVAPLIPDGKDVPDTDPKDVAGKPQIYAAYGHDVPDTDPSDVAGPSGVASGSAAIVQNAGSHHVVKRPISDQDSPERLPLKKRKSSRDSISPEKNTASFLPCDAFTEKDARDLSLLTVECPPYPVNLSPLSQSQKPGRDETDHGNGDSVEEKKEEENAKHDECVPSSSLQRQSSHDTLLADSPDEKLSQHAFGKDDVTKKMGMKGRDDSGVSIASTSTATTSSVTSGLPSMTAASSSSAEARAFNDLCMICSSKPKTASIIHGRTGHQVCCYSCAKKLRRHGKPCPVCRRPIQMVVKNFLL